MRSEYQATGQKNHRINSVSIKERLITDTHFDHDAIGMYCDRPDGWMDLIIRNWRNEVQPEDLVIHLGDVVIGSGRELKALLDSLPGTKVMVMGNHDTHSRVWYMRNGFAFACDAFAYKGVTFTHKPALSLIDGTDINIHGHVHNSLWVPSRPFQRLLALEHENYRPVELQKFVNMARSPKHWAEHVRKWKVPQVTAEKRRNARLSAQ